MMLKIVIGGLLVANLFFSIALKKAAYTPCGIMKKHCRTMLLDIRLIFGTITIQFRFSFHNCKCENTSFVAEVVVVFLVDLLKDT